MSRQLLLIVLVAFSTVQGEELPCRDSQNRLVESGANFAPTGDPCLSCRCTNGVVGKCVIIDCRPPPCENFTRVRDSCCDVTCPSETLVESGSRDEEPAALPADMTRTVNQCCTLGRQWFQQTSQRCDPYPSVIPGVSIPDIPTCKAAAEVCCLAEKQEAQCTMGQETAKLTGMCHALHNQPGREHSRECCSCCLLGKLARSHGASCSMMSGYTRHCTSSFTSCCLTGENPTTATTQPPTTTTTTTTTSTTTSGPVIPREENYCLRFENLLCPHICVPTPGSYTCICREGYRKSGMRCIPIPTVNSCETSNPCQHECIDTGVSIQCKCFDGYLPEADGRVCNDLNECTTGIHSCANGQTCVNTIGSFRCIGSAEPSGTSCPDGFAWNRVASRCEDIDECILGRHDCGADQVCMNFVGNFDCLDEEDYDDTEGEVDDGLPPLDCGTGFAYNRHTRTCTDVNECETDDHDCTGQHQTCRNTVGSHRCTCTIGYQYNPMSRQCEDLNECAMNRDSCIEGQTCENTIGSYVCRRTISCGTGYTLDQASQQCVDDDECYLGTHNCGLARECRNVPGSFRCELKECPYAYKLNYQNGQCEPVICPRGYKPDSAGSCIDRNECVDSPQVCRPDQECRNTLGSYSCRNQVTCGAGYQINSAGTGCQDVDECSEGTHNCRGPRMQCINRPGTYLCQCPDGYQLNQSAQACDDIDECIRYNNQVCSLNSICENTPGSFRCTCSEGFESHEDGRLCRDVDECDRQGLCQHTCRNTWGSYACMCNDGYQLGPDERSCVDVDECQVWEDRGGKLCIGVCQNTQGSYECACPDGYRMMSDRRTCQDVDECATRIADCHGSNDVCINIRGSYKCETITCPSGFVRVPSLDTRSNGDPSGVQSDDSRRYLSDPSRFDWNDLDVEEDTSGDSSSWYRPQPRYRNWRSRTRRVAKNRGARGVPPYQPSEDQNIVCQRLNCAANDIDCVLNKTMSIQWHHVVLPSLRRLPDNIPLVLVNVRTIGYSIYPNLRFTIVSGNEDGLFDVVLKEGSRAKGSVRLLRHVQGPASYNLKLRMDNRNRFNTVITTHIAFIEVRVSEYDF